MAFSASATQNGGNAFKPMTLMSENFAFVDEEDQQQTEEDQQMEDQEQQEEQPEENDKDEDQDGIEGQEEEQELDPISQVLLTRLPSAPIPSGSLHEFQKSRALKLKLNPTNSEGIAYVATRPDINRSVKAQPEDIKLYPTPIPSLKATKAYYEYVRNLYEIYKDLGDFKSYGVGIIGLIRHGVSAEQSVKLSQSFQLLREALRTYIDSEEDQFTQFELEEVLNVLNCLYFSFFLEGSEESSYVEGMKEWVNFADPQPELELSQDIFNKGNPYEHPLFWDFVQKLVLRGLTDQAASALEDSQIIEHYKSQNVNIYDVLVDLKELIKSYPANSTLDFFRSWKSLTLQAFENSKRLTSTTTEDLELIKSIQSTLHILTGSKPHVLSVSETWYESLLALFLYHHPSSTLLSEYLTLISTHHTPNANSIWELTTHSILKEGQILQCLQSISSFDATTASYLAVILEAKGLLQSYTDFATLSLDTDLFSTNGSTRISEYFLTQHALSCLSQPELFSLGVGLLSQSSNPYARQVIAEALPRYDFATDDDLEWAITVCASLRLPETAHLLYRVAGQRALSDSRVYDALVLFGKAGDVNTVKRFALLVFERCLVSQGADQDEFINSLVQDNAEIKSGLIRQCIAPYVILTQYYQFLESGDVRPAMSKLLRLLNFKFIPTEYISILLIELLKILIVYKRTVMTKCETLQLISTLDDYESALKQDSKTNDIAQRYYEIAKDAKGVNDAHCWSEQFERIGVSVPKEVEGVVTLVRGVVAGVLAKLFLEDKRE